MPRLPADLRRASLLDAAVTVLLERGFAYATTRDVAAHLGIGRGLIHHYFSSWEALQREAFARLAEQELKAADTALAGLPPAEALAALLDWLVPEPDDRHWRLWKDVWDEAQRDRELAALYVDLVDRWRGRLRAVIEAGVVGGEFRCDDASAAAWRLLALAEGLGGYLLLSSPPLERCEVLAHLRLAAARELGCDAASTADSRARPPAVTKPAP